MSFLLLRQPLVRQPLVRHLTTRYLVKRRRSRISPSMPQSGDCMPMRMAHATTCDNSPLLLAEEDVVEEEKVRGYKAEHYYPVQSGNLFQEKYKVIGKLGYGSASTVWLCSDLRKENEYVALKVYINSSKVHRELPIYDHINSLLSQHEGRNHVRKLLDSFEVSGPHGKHTCLVHEALGMNLEELRELVPGRVFAADLVRQSLRDVLRGMHFLHEEAQVIHTDIQPKNILLGVLDNSAFVRFERDEQEHPMPRKHVPSRTVYVSRPMPLTKGSPSLCDLSEARFGNTHNDDLVMPDVYRAPEVVLGMPWSYPIDVWGFAMTLWDLFEPRRLFSPHDEQGRYSEHRHVAQMISIMGPPPLELLRRSEKSHLFWDEEGQWKDVVPIPDNSLETAEQRLEGEEKQIFLRFLRKMLKWRPEEREDVRGVFMDEWLLADLIKAGKVVSEQ